VRPTRMEDAVRTAGEPRARTTDEEQRSTFMTWSVKVKEVREEARWWRVWVGDQRTQPLLCLCLCCKMKIGLALA
jgi:hypothetical protein